MHTEGPSTIASQMVFCLPFFPHIYLGYHIEVWSSKGKRQYPGHPLNLNWAQVYSELDVKGSFDLFWNTFYDLYKIHFPMTKAKFSRNVHKVNNYMTRGLLISKATELNLHKKAVKEQTHQATEHQWWTSTLDSVDGRHRHFNFFLPKVYRPTSTLDKVSMPTIDTLKVSMSTKF